MKIFRYLLCFFAAAINISCSQNIPSDINTDITEDPEEDPVDNTGPNAITPLIFNNYLGNAENIHPKVLYFEDGWNGFEYWMAYTPYPWGDTNAENPCIAASHDGIEWETPEGLSNPLSKCPENGYNSDTHLLYNKEQDLMEIWWRPYDIPSASDAVVRRISSNGISWSDPEIMIPFGERGQMRLSPVIWKEGDIYTMIYSNGTILLETHLDATEEDRVWSEPIALPIDWGEFKAWHQDGILNENGDLELVVNLIAPGGNNNTTDLYYSKVSRDRSTASDLVCILERGKNKTDFDHRAIYRSSLVKVGQEYRLYYSCIDDDWHRHMALLTGPSPFDLTGRSK